MKHIRSSDIFRGGGGGARGKAMKNLPKRLVLNQAYNVSVLLQVLINLPIFISPGVRNVVGAISGA